jgi:hypothetical protein
VRITLQVFKRNIDRYEDFAEKAIEGRALGGSTGFDEAQLRLSRMSQI